MLKRRHCLAAAVATFAVPMARQVQAQKKLPVVGFLQSQFPLSPEQIAANPMLLRLRELGWEHGKTAHFEAVYAEGQQDRLPGLAVALVAKNVDVIVTSGGAGVRAAKLATDTIPIVAVGPNLVTLGYAGSFARPGGNITGLTLDAGPGLAAKRLELLKLAVPAVKRVAYFRSAGQSRAATDEALAAARALGIELAMVMVDGTADLDAAFASVSRHRPDAIWAADTAANSSNRARIIEFAARERLPAIYGFPQFAESGGLMSYGINIDEFNSRGALYVDKILRGAKPGDLPIEQATLLELAINLKTARALGLVLPQVLLISAQRVIE